MKDISNFTSSFNINKTATYMLSLQISQRGYTYSIIDPFIKQYVGLKHVGYGMELSDENLYDKIKENLSSDAFMSKSYKSVNMIYATRKSVFVPNAVFDKTALKAIASANFPIAATEEIQFNKLKSISAYNVFVVPSFITTLMVNTFPEINFYHQATPFVENLLQNAGEALRVSVNLYYDFADVAITGNRKLLFYNTFGYHTPTDLLYAVTNVIAKTKTDKKTPIYISGYLDKDSDYFTLLYKYFANVYTATPLNNIEFPFKEVEPFIFNNVITLPLCV